VASDPATRTMSSQCCTMAGSDTLRGPRVLKSPHPLAALVFLVSSPSSIAVSAHHSWVSVISACRGANW